MRIKKLTVENFRCFDKLEIDFPSNNLAVFIGVNGAGKSSLLDLMRNILRVLIYRIIERICKAYPVYSLLMSKNDDLKTLYKLDDFEYESNYKIDVVLSNNLANSQELIRISGKAQELIPISGKAGNLSYYASDLVNYETEGFIEYIENIIKYKFISYFCFPVFCYYKNFQILGDNYSSRIHEKRSDFYPIPQLKAYDESLSSKATDFTVFIHWFCQEEDYENQIRIRENTDFKNINLELIRKVLVTFLSQFHKAEFSNLRIDRSRYTNKSIKEDMSEIPFHNYPILYSLVITKNGQDLEIEQLSDGEKMLLMLVVDIGRRLTIANPSLGIDAWQGEGIILIDEIETHLHPQWQRNIIPALMNTFPNCQFIVTTHSPQVLSKVPRESVFILENSQVSEFKPYTYGRDSNSILSEVMGVSERPEDIQEKIDRCYRLLDQEKLEEAKDILKELSELLGQQDSEIVSINSSINFLFE